MTDNYLLSMYENQYDIIIGGAGISGLLLASELSKTHKVLVIEAKEAIEENKFWVTLKSCLLENSHLKTTVDSYFTQMEFADSSRNRHFITGEYILWDTLELQNYLLNSIILNGGKVLFSQRFCGYKTSNSNITVYFNENAYSAAKTG